MSSSYLSSIAKQILSRALFFGSVRAQKGQGAMRAAKGIFRTVDEPFGQVDARPSKSYRISWIGVCSLVAPATTLLPGPILFRHSRELKAYLFRCCRVDSVSGYRGLARG